MDLESEIIQLVRQNIRPKFPSLNDEQQARLDNALKYDVNYDILKKELVEYIDDWKRNEYYDVLTNIGDLQRLDLGNMLNGDGVSFPKLHSDLANLPRFRLIDNENEMDQSLLHKYDSLRTRLIEKCRAIELIRSATNTDVNYQDINSMLSVVELRQWRDEIQMEWKELAQNLELILKTWPDLTEEKRSKLLQLIDSSSLKSILHIKDNIE
ncbi:Nkp1p [Kluyveromyces lactis]|uniref:Inner kinetochore subunit NKP1 n=1 Tax=Kluyveromyces lactis (strain ATCC 8585 / CBS 2359 / DSM 70799 / NBRC 1267 / NRRL Y-1140 / WM37) TaxID=284590 RepID=NKP1_KLULA|nr:uncharacterized protein KLLA0_E02883g [Kluyveromyces lactis]Q6CPR4.1 RecName: Full=Inner kinetochore subunit NKP1; AltName: Full=Constitutive centromere-associated network protein NKP1 [Kluyveromyces lactis NRRL Y-1140]CAG99162.1 KLLA0E02883p [Kluyveromyces lactis]|eukprot:XP_454075.1 uncharacterized protein KLLA0_E02883g [Kluyveromyces lactis]